MIVGGACHGLVDRRFFVVAVGLVIGSERLVPIFQKALARDTAHALFALIVLAHVFFVLARGDGGLLFVPVRLVDVVIVGAGVALQEHYFRAHARTFGAGADLVDANVFENAWHGFMRLVRRL